MITRLILSLKRAASTENGWLFSEMTTVRLTDETDTMHLRSGYRTRPLLGGNRARQGSRALGADNLEEASIGVPEEIGMAITENLEEPR